MSKHQCARDAILKEYGSLINRQNEEKISKLQATIERVRERIHWTPPKEGQHTNGPCYVFYGGYRRIIEDILDGHESEAS